MNLKLRNLLLALQFAEERLLEEMRSSYPIGARITVKIQRNHQTPTAVEVVGYVATFGNQKRRGGLRVRILASRNGAGFLTTVPIDQVIDG